MSVVVKALRSLACSEYHKSVAHNEVSTYLNCDDWQRWRIDWHLPGPGLQVHHIFGRGGPEHEHRSNLIMVSACAHAWGHDKCPNEFRLACLKAKFEKRTYWEGLDGSVLMNQYRDQIASEFDVPTLEKLTGVPLVDWLECQALKVSGAYHEYAIEIMEWLQKSDSCDSRVEPAQIEQPP